MEIKEETRSLHSHKTVNQEKFLQKEPTNSLTKKLSPPLTERSSGDPPQSLSASETSDMNGSPFATTTQSVYREISHKEKLLDNSTYHRKLGEFPHNSLELLHVPNRQLRIILKLFTMIALEVRGDAAILSRRLSLDSSSTSGETPAALSS